MKKLLFILWIGLSVTAVSCDDNIDVLPKTDVTAGTDDNNTPDDGNTGGDNNGDTDNGGNTDGNDTGGNTDGGDDNGGTGDGETNITLYDIAGNVIQFVRDYTVTGENVDWQNNKDRHQEMWTHFTKLVPENERNSIDDFLVFNGNNSLLGYVYNKDNSLTKWFMGLDISSAYSGGSFNSELEFSYTSIHEYFHVKSLDHNQLNPNESGCTTYNPGEGCSRESSYINLFYDKFWKQYGNVGEDADLYSQHPEHFVTGYAATNPAEDIAESFTAFVFKQRPTGNAIKDQKVEFFYNYPDLVNLRNSMRSELNRTTRGRMASFSTASGFDQIASKRQGKTCGYHKGRH